MPVDAYYKHLASVGADYGPAFRGIEEIWRTEGEALGKIKLPDSLMEEVAKYSIHPALLDACFQLTGVALPGAGNLDSAENEIIYVPVGIRNMRIYEAPGASVYCHVRMNTSETPSVKTLSGDLTLFDQSGRVIAVVNGLLLQQINQQALRRAVQIDVDN
jgi:acyl transferase domain-containing protein